MKKISRYLTLILFLFSQVPVQAMTLDGGLIQEGEKSEFSDLQEVSNEASVDSDAPTEETVADEQIETSPALPESSEADLVAQDNPSEESVEPEVNPAVELPKDEDPTEETVAPTEDATRSDFTHSQTINGVDYEWEWDAATRTLDFNANNGNSADAIQAIRANGLTSVQYLTLRNLSEATIAFQALNDLVMIELINVSIIGAHSFRGIVNLTEITFNDAIEVLESAFQECTSLVKVNNSIAMTAIHANAFNGTAIEELEVATASSSSQSLNGMNSLKRLVNRGGGNISGFVGASLPALEIYEGFDNGASLYNTLTTFLNSLAPNLRIVRLDGGGRSGFFSFDLLDFSQVPYLEEFTYINIGSVGNLPLRANAFRSLEHLQTVRIDGVQGIGENAFSDTPNLEQMTLNNVRRIGNAAFRNTPSLKTVLAPRLTTIGNSTFASTGLEEITFPLLEETGNYPFENNDYLIKADLPNLRLGGWQLFSRCRALEEVNLPKLERVNHADFLQTYNLETLYLPSAISFNGSQNFFSSGIQNLILPKIDLTDAPVNAFYGVTIDYLETAYASDAERLREIFNSHASIITLQINDQAVFGNEYANIAESNTTLEKIILPNTTHIGNSMFINMTSLREVDAPKLVGIGDETFSNTGVVDVVFPELKSMGRATFYNTSQLNSVVLNNLQEMGAQSFQNSAIKYASMKSIESIPGHAFFRATMLEKLEIPNVRELRGISLSQTTSLKEIDLDNLEVIDGGVFQGSGIERLDLPSVHTIRNIPFQGTNFLKYVNIPNIQVFGSLETSFYESSRPWESIIPGTIVNGIDTSYRNSSAIEVIMTKKENAHLLEPLLADENLRLVLLATDGEEVIDSEPVIAIKAGDLVDIPVYQDIIVNQSLENVRANVSHVWLHDGATVILGDNLFFNEIMPWHAGIYQRHMSVRFSQTNEEIFVHDSNTVELNVDYTNEIEVEVSILQDEIIIDETTSVEVIIKNSSGYSDVNLSTRFINGHLEGIEVIEGSVEIDGVKQTGLPEDITLLRDKEMTITYDVRGVNNESVEYNIEVMLYEYVEAIEAIQVWGGATRLVVNNGRLRFSAGAPEYIDFNNWNSENPLTLGAITEQNVAFNLAIEDLRGSNTSPENEIQGNRSSWRVLAHTDNRFVSENKLADEGLFRLVGLDSDNIIQDVNTGFVLHAHVPNNELPLTSREHQVTVGEEKRLGVMLNQINGLQENTQYQVDLTFELVDAP